MFRVRINGTEFDCARTAKPAGCTYYDTYTLPDGRTFSRYRDHAQRAAAQGTPIGIVDGFEVFAVQGFTPGDAMESFALKRKLAENGVPDMAPTKGEMHAALFAHLFNVLR